MWSSNQKRLATGRDSPTLLDSANLNAFPADFHLSFFIEAAGQPAYWIIAVVCFHAVSDVVFHLVEVGRRILWSLGGLFQWYMLVLSWSEVSSEWLLSFLVGIVSAFQEHSEPVRFFRTAGAPWGVSLIHFILLLLESHSNKSVEYHHKRTSFDNLRKGTKIWRYEWNDIFW